MPNPILRHSFAADPNAVVIDGRMYAICSHDYDGMQGWDMQAYTLLSTVDMVNWTDHGDVFNLKKVAWGSSDGRNLDAPALIARNGKCYLYYPVNGRHISVAIADSVMGPYTDPLGRPLLDKSMPNCNVQWLFDPAVFVDSDDQAYLYFGGGESPAQCRVIKLNQDMISISGTAITIDIPGYLEAPFMHKYRDKYYLSFATHWVKARIDYALSDGPMTGFEYKGTILAPLPDNMEDNSHGSVVEYKGKWYVFYHNRTLTIGRGENNRFNRTPNVDLLEYDSDGTIRLVTPTPAGVPQVELFDPFGEIPATTMSDESGVRTVEQENGPPQLSVAHGDWVKLSRVDFRAGARVFSVHAPAPRSKAIVEICLDSLDSAPAGVCDITAKASIAGEITATCPLSAVDGVHDLYLRFILDPQTRCDICWYRFE